MLVAEDLPFNWEPRIYVLGEQHVEGLRETLGLTRLPIFGVCDADQDFQELETVQRTVRVLVLFIHLVVSGNKESVQPVHPQIVV